MLNKVMIIGNLCGDPELRYTNNQTPVATLSVATNRKWKDKDGNPQEDVEFHRVIVWAQAAEFCANYLKKGNKVYVEGRLQTRKYEKDGQTHYTTEIVAQTVQNLSPKRDGGGGSQRQEEPPIESYGGIGEDVPF